MTKGEVAKNNFLLGMTCSEAVATAFSEEIGIDRETLSNLSLGFGGGLARQRLVCGAVSGMTMVLSFFTKNLDKASRYKVIQDACLEFKNEVGSLICGELLGVKNDGLVPEKRTEEYYKKRPCADLCLLAGDIAEKYINKLNGTI